MLPVETREYSGFKGQVYQNSQVYDFGGVLYCGLYRDLKADIFGDSTLSEVSF